MATIDELNETLAGSPYLLNNDAIGAKRAEVLAEAMDAIVLQHADVERRFAAERYEVVDRLEELVGARFVYESNALELTGLPLDETRRAIGEAPRDLDDLAKYLTERAVTADRHLIDVLGLYRANLFVGVLASDYRSHIPIHEVDIRSLHAATVPTERFAGRYREIEVGISGSEHEPPSVLDVPRQMHELVVWLNETEAPPALAATVVHSWLTIIHPFEDGNGRVARLLANLVLIRNGWPALIVRASDRLQYLDALAASDEGGDLLPLFDLFVKSIRRSLKELSRPGLAERLFEADLQQRHEVRYALWSEMLNSFLETLREALRDDGFDLDRLAVPNASTYLLLCDGESSGNTWLAKVRRRDGRDYLIWLGFMSREMKDYGGPESPAPSLFVSERDHAGVTPHPYLNPFVSGSPVNLQEITLIPTVKGDPALTRYATYNVDGSTVESAALRLAEVIASACG